MNYIDQYTNKSFIRTVQFRIGKFLSLMLIIKTDKLVCFHEYTFYINIQYANKHFSITFIHNRECLIK